MSTVELPVVVYWLLCLFAGYGANVFARKIWRRLRPRSRVSCSLGYIAAGQDDELFDPQPHHVAAVNEDQQP